MCRSGCYDNVAGLVGCAVGEGISCVGVTARVMGEGVSALIETARVMGESLRVRREVWGLVGKPPATFTRVRGRRAGRREAALLVGTWLRGRLVVGRRRTARRVGEARI